MKKSLILLILPLLFAAGCGNDRSPVDVTEPLSPEEAQVVANCLTVQQAVEDFAVQNSGVYPANTAVDTTPSGDTVLDLLPSGVWLLNPFTTVQTEPVNGIAANPGETAYESIIQGGVPVAYSVTGVGEIAATIIITLTN